MITLTQLGLGGSGSSLGDTIYRHGEAPLITRDDGSVYIRSGTLLTFDSEYESSRNKLPKLFQKNTRALSIVHNGDISAPPYASVYSTQFFHANNNYYAISQSTATGKMSVASNLTSSYSAVTGTPAGASTWVVDFVKVGNNIAVTGSHLDGTTAAVKLGYINTTTNTFVSAAAVGVNVPVGLLASNGNAAVFRGISNVGNQITSNDANAYYTTNGATWTVSTSTSNLFNPMCFFWSPAAQKYIFATRSDTIVVEGLATPVLDENGSNIAMSYLTLFSSEHGYDYWYLNNKKPGTTGDVNNILHLANALYRYENDISTSDALKYPASPTYIYRTSWQSLYANSPTASIFSPGMYQAIARTTNGTSCDIVDLSPLLNDPVKTTQRIYVAWDGNYFLAFYGDIVLYSLDGLTWARTPHLLYSVVPTAYGTMAATTPTAISVANNRLVSSFYGFSSPYVPFTYAAEFTNMYLANTTPTTMGSLTVNYVWGGSNSGTTFAYSYTRIK